MIDVDSDHDKNKSLDSNDSRTFESIYEYCFMLNLHSTKYPLCALFHKLCDKLLEWVSIFNTRYYDSIMLRRGTNMLGKGKNTIWWSLCIQIQSVIHFSCLFWLVDGSIQKGSIKIIKMINLWYKLCVAIYDRSCIWTFGWFIRYSEEVGGN